jgi:uncharacterized protein
VDPGRTAEVAEVAARVVRWALDRPDVRAVGMVGSWARGDARPDSDVDLVVLADDPARLRRGEWAPVSWAAVPVDEGTAHVVADGLRVLLDPDGLLTRLVEAVARRS